MGLVNKGDDYMGFLSRLFHKKKFIKQEEPKSIFEIKVNPPAYHQTAEDKERQNQEIKNILEYEKNSSNPKFHRTKSEENASFNFFFKYKKRIDLLQNELINSINLIAKTKDVDIKIQRCKDAIIVYDKYKNFCYSKGTGGKIYFDDMWEHCHNSKNPDFSYIQNVKDEYDYLINNRAKLIFEQQIDIKISKFKRVSEKELKAYIKNNPGILQKNIYKEFDTDYKNVIKSALESMDKENKIIRKKYGNSYELYIKN